MPIGNYIFGPHLWDLFHLCRAMTRVYNLQQFLDEFHEKTTHLNQNYQWSQEEFHQLVCVHLPTARFQFFESKGKPIAVLEGQVRFRVCDTCQVWFAGSKKRWCSGCCMRVYCSRACQVTHWPQHRRECKVHWTDLSGQPSCLSNPQGTKMFFRPCGYCGRKTQGTPLSSICDRCRNSCHFCNNQVRDSLEVD